MEQAIKNWDRGLITIILILTLAGSLFFYDASIIPSIQIYNNPHHYFYDFLLKNVLTGLLIFFLFSFMSWRWLKKSSNYFLALIIIMMLLSFLSIFHLPGQASARWFHLGVFNLQPSEFLKFFLILFFSFFYISLGRQLKKRSERVWVAVAILAVISLIVFLQPALSNLLILWAGVIAGIISLRPSWRDLMPFFVLILIFVVVGISFWGYRLARLKAKFFSHNSASSAINFQQRQTELAIGSGGLFGKGLAGSQIKLIGIPLMLTDSIFAVYAEEFGFVGSILMIGSFLYLIGRIFYRGLNVASDEKKFFAFGIGTWLSIQIFIHIASNSGLLAATGVPLPFFSDGASSQIAIMMALGVINNLEKS